MGKGGKGKASSQICLAATVPRDVRDDMTYHYQTENQAAVKAWADLIRGKGRHSLPKYFWLWSLWSGQSYRMMKNIEIIATWCQIIRLKRHQIRFWMGALPQTPLGELAALPMPQLTPSLLRASKQLASPNMYPKSAYEWQCPNRGQCSELIQ